MRPRPDSDLDGLARALEREYPDIAPVASIAPMDVPLVSSRIYTLETARGTLCAKVPGYARRLGQPSDELQSEWTLILDLQDRLHARGVPVEETLRTRSGALAIEHAGRLCRVVRHVPSRPFTGSDPDLRAAGRALGLFHAAGRDTIEADPALAAGVRARLVRDMPLADSLAAWPDLRAELLRADLTDRHPGCRDLAAEFAEIRRAVDGRIDPLCRRAAQRLGGLPATPSGLGHYDYHPANVLFRASGSPVILDLEQIAIGPLVKCAALGATRFAMEACRVAPGRDERAAAAAFVGGWTEAFPAGAVAVARIPDWIRLYELEKILRILRRALAGSVVPAMVRKILTHHLPLCERADEFRS